MTLEECLDHHNSRYASRTSNMILRRGRNAWRVERADRMAVLVDGGAFFRAVREALLKARRSVFIVGWDLHSQTRLVGETDRADDRSEEHTSELQSLRHLVCRPLIEKK